MNHYFTDNQNLRTKEKDIYFKIYENKFHFITDNGVFSKSGLDFGSRLLIETIYNIENHNILDLGCGYGPIGLTYKYFNPNALVTLIDVNKRAIELSKRNANLNKLDVDILISNGYSSLNKNMRFDLIISNPPVRVGKKLLYKLLEEARDFLNMNGKLIYVIHKNLGAKSSLIFCENIYRKVTVINKKSGYFVIQCEKWLTIL